MRRAQQNREKYGIVTEAERIRRLPVQDFSRRTDLVDKWTARFARPTLTRPLRPVQAEILEEAAWSAQQDDPVGLLGNVGVGKGKTLAFFLLPEVFDAQRPLLIVPPDMREQLAENFWDWRQEYSFRLRPENVIYYSQLSRPEATDLLRKYDPDLIMADEAHCLRHPSAARTKRFLRYMKTERPNTRFVAMSGTLTGSTLSDYAHLAKLALRQYSPLPSDDRDIAIWGSVLNTDGEPDDIAWRSVRFLDPDAAESRDVHRLRKAYNTRLRTTPGVVCTDTPSCDAELVLTAHYPPLTAPIRDALNTLKVAWELPNGLEIVDALSYHRALAQVSCGFYYVWDWPDDEADKEWLATRRDWWSMCRWYLSRYAREGCDSPFLVEEYVKRTGRPPELRAALARWEEHRWKDPPPTRAIWIDPSPVVDAVKWAQSRDRAFLWYRSRAVGDMLEAFGIPRFGAGDGRPKVREHPVCALSIPVHHKGKNYQAWADQLILEPPSSGAVNEQLLGRTHRQGQTSAVVRADVFQHTWPLRQSFRKACERAAYIQDTTGQRQKLLLATKRGFTR